jgi:DNA adenine methylase
MTTTDYAAPGPKRAPRQHVQPIIKWAGSKRWLVPLIGDLIYERLAVSGGRYVEPFLGGAALMVLGDSCRPLVEMYEAIRADSRSVTQALKALIEFGTDKESYLLVRGERAQEPDMVAARFIYLNKLGFNGLYRVNRKGQFNVPYGDKKRGERAQFGGVFPSDDDLAAVAAAFADADLALRDFRETVALAEDGDLLYADPPYLETYSSYTPEGFADEDHLALADALHAAAKRGVTVLATNSDNDRIRELYEWAAVTPVIERHNVGATVQRRGAVRTLFITSDPAILRQVG